MAQPRSLSILSLVSSIALLASLSLAQSSSNYMYYESSYSQYGYPANRTIILGSKMLFPPEYMAFIQNGTYAFRFRVWSVSSEESKWAQNNYNMKQLFKDKNPQLSHFVLGTGATIQHTVFTYEVLLQEIVKSDSLILTTQFFDKYGIITQYTRYEYINHLIQGLNTACTNALGAHFTRNGQIVPKNANDELELQLVQDANDDIKLVLKAQDFITGCNQLTINSVIQAGVSFNDLTVQNFSTPHSSCYLSYNFGQNTNCTANTVFPANCTYYGSNFTCYDVKDSKDQTIRRCNSHRYGYCYIWMRNDTVTNQPIMPYFANTTMLYGQYDSATHSIPLDFLKVFLTTNDTDTVINDKIYIQFIVKATVANQAVYYMMQSSVKTVFNAKHPVAYDGCLSTAVNAQQDRGCFIDYQTGKIKPKLTFRQAPTGVVVIKARFYTQAENSDVLTQVKEVAGDGSVEVTATDLYDLDGPLEFIPGFEVTVDGAARYSLVLRRRKVQIAPPPAANIANAPCAVTLELKDMRNKVYQLPQNISDVFNLQQSMNETWTLNYNVPANCASRLARMTLTLQQDLQTSCKGTNECLKSSQTPLCDKVAYSNFQCNCATPGTCSPNYLPNGYTSVCEKTNDTYGYYPGLRCNITDPDTKQTFCAVSTCNATYSQYWYHYNSYSWGQNEAAILEKFLEKSVPLPYKEAKFQLAEFAEKKSQNYYNKDKTVYIHASWYNPTTKAVVVTRQKLDLDAYAPYFYYNCKVFDKINNNQIATTYFDNTFTHIVQFAKWRETVPVNAVLKDPAKYKVSALIGKLRHWYCDYTYEYPDTSTMTSFGIQLSQTLAGQVPFLDVVKLQSDTYYNYTIVLTVLNTVDGSVYKQYISLGTLKAGYKAANLVTDTTTCFKVGATLDYANRTGSGNLTTFDIYEKDYHPEFNVTAFRVNVNSTLPASATNPACANTTMLYCKILAFTDLNTFHLMKNDNLGFCNTALRVEKDATCTLANNAYSCNGVELYTECADRLAKDGTTTIQMCQRTNPDTGLLESVVLLPTALMATTGDICQKETEEAMFQGDLQKIWDQSWRYISYYSSYYYRYFSNGQTNSSCFHHFIGQEFTRKWAKERFQQNITETSYAHILVNQTGVVEWIRKPIALKFYQMNSAPPILYIQALVNSTYIPRGLAFKNPVLTANLFLNTHSPDIGTGPYTLSVQLKENSALVGQDKNLGGTTYNGVMFNYPTLFDEVTPKLLGVKNTTTSQAHCYNYTYCVSNPYYNQTNTNNTFGATNSTNPTGTNSTYPTGTNSTFLTNGTSPYLNQTCSTYQYCNSTAQIYLNNSVTLQYSFKAKDQDSFTRFAQDSMAIYFFPPKPADATTPGATDCMVNQHSLKINTTTIAQGTSGAYSVSVNSTRANLTFSSTNAACTNMTTLIEERLLTFENANLICQVENTCYVDGADHYCQHMPNNYCYDDKCWLYFAGQYISVTYTNVTHSGKTYKRVVMEKDGVRSCYVMGRYFPYAASSQLSYISEHEVTTGVDFGSVRVAPLQYMIDTSQFLRRDIKIFKLYHHAIYRADANTFKYTLTPVSIGLDDGSLYYQDYYSIFIKHGVPVTYPSVQLSPSSVNNGCKFKQISLVMVNRTWNTLGEYSEKVTEIMAPVTIDNTLTALDNTTTLYKGTDVIVSTLQKFQTLRTDYPLRLAFNLTIQCGTTLNTTRLGHYLSFAPPFKDVIDACNSTFSIITPGGTALTPQVVNNTNVYKIYNPQFETSSYKLRLDNSNCAGTQLQVLGVSQNPIFENICFNSYQCPDFPEPGCSREYLNCYSSNVCYDYYNNYYYCQQRHNYGFVYQYCPKGDGCIVNSFYYPNMYSPEREVLSLPANGVSQVDIPFTPSTNTPFFIGQPGYSYNNTYYAKIFYAKSDLSSYYFRTVTFQLKPEWRNVSLTVKSSPLQIYRYHSLSHTYFHTAYNAQAQVVAELTGVDDNGVWLIRLGTIDPTNTGKYLADFTGVKDGDNVEPIQYTYSPSAVDIFKIIGYHRKVIPLGLTYQRVEDPLPAQTYIDQHKGWFMEPPAPADNAQALTCLTLTNTVKLGGNVVTLTNQEYVFDQLASVEIESELVDACQGKQIVLRQLLLRNHTNLVHECIQDGFCNNTIAADATTLNKTAAAINTFLYAKQATQVKENNKIKTTFQLQNLKFMVGNEKVTIYQHVLATDETNNALVYKQFSVVFDLSQTGSTDPSKSCDVNFCQLPVLPIVFNHDYNELDSCETGASGPGTKRRTYFREFNQTVTVKLVPDMKQCQINSRDFLTKQANKYHFNYTKLAATIGKQNVYDRALSGWYISPEFCYSSSCRYSFSWVNGQYEFTFSAKELAQNYTSAYNWNRRMKICARFSGCDYDTCTPFELPPHYAAKPQSAPFNTTVKASSTKLEPVSGSYQITEDDDLVIEVPSSCNLLYHELRLYYDREIECSRWNTCKNGNEESIRSDKDCELRPMKCTAGTCVDHNFETFTNCETVTIGSATRQKCVKTYANYTQTCVYSTTLVRPQESNAWGKCYVQATWNADGCNCVSCKEKVNQASSCVSILAVPSCPAPTTTNNCNSYYDYMWKLQEEDITVSNDFSPKDPLNNMLTFGTYKYDNKIYVQPISYARYYANYFSRNIYQYSTTQTYTLPSNEFNYYALYVCAKPHSNDVFQYGERIKFQKKTLTPEQQDEKSKYKTLQYLKHAIGLQDKIDVRVTEQALMPEKTEEMISYKGYGPELQFTKTWNVEKQQKWQYIKWSNKLERIIVTTYLQHVDFGKLDEHKNAVYLDMGLTSVNKPTTELTYSFTQQGQSIRTIGGKEVVRKGIAIDASFLYTGINIAYVFATTYMDLTKGCQHKEKRTCSTLPSNICGYTNLHCARNATGALNCYDGFNRHFANCSDTYKDENNRAYTRCDYNDTAEYGVVQYNCVIDIPTSSNLYQQHILENTACAQATANCPVNQTCYALYKAGTSLHNKTDCVPSATYSKYYTSLQATQSYKFPYDTVNDALNLKLEESQTMLVNSEYKHKILPSVFEENAGQHKPFYYHVISNLNNVLYYQVLSFNALFSTSATYDTEPASLKLTNHNSWNVQLTYGTALSLQFQIIGLSAQAVQADYRFIQIKLGVRDETQYTTTNPLTYSTSEVFQILEYSDPTKALCFKVINRATSYEYPQQCVTLLLKYPPASFAETIDCTGNLAPTITYDEGQAVVNNGAGKPYMSTSRKNKLAFDLTTCNVFNTATHEVKYLALTHGADMHVARCKARGTCAKENIDCTTKIMTCKVVTGGSYNCTDIWGFNMTGGVQVTDNNSVSTIRVDHNGACFLQDNVIKHPADLTSSTLKSCYDFRESTCFSGIPMSCMQNFAKESQDPNLSTSITSSAQCETLRRAISQYKTDQEADYEKRGYNKRVQFVFTRDESFHLNLWLKGSHVQKKSATSYQIEISSSEHLPVTSQLRTLYAHFLIAVTNGNTVSFGYFKVSLEAFVFSKKQYQSEMVVGVSGGYYIDWNQQVELSADDSNWDPTKQKSVYALFQDQNYAKTVFPNLNSELTRNGANLTLTLDPLKMVKLAGMSKNGGLFKFDPVVTAPSDVTSVIKSFWNYQRPLRGPETPAGRCSYQFTAKFDDGTTVTAGASGFPITFSDTKKREYIEFTITVKAGCTLTPLYWMPRAYSDLAIDKQNYDYVAQNQFCYPYPMLCSSATNCKSIGSSSYEFTQCTKATDGAPFEHTICRNSDVCYLKDTSISDAELTAIAGCFAANTWNKSTCKDVLPYCYNYWLNAEEYFGSKLITQYGYTLPEIIDLFKLTELTIEIAWDTAKQNTASLTGQALVDALKNQYDIDFDWNIKAAVKEKYKFYDICSKLYEDGNIFSGQSGRKFWTKINSTPNWGVSEELANILENFITSDITNKKFQLKMTWLKRVFNEATSYGPLDLYMHMIAQEQGSTTPNYERETLKLDIQQSNLDVEFFGFINSGATVTNQDEFYLALECDDPDDSTTGTYEINYTCTPSSEICDEIVSQNPAGKYPKFDYSSFETQELLKIPNGSYTITATCIKKVNNAVQSSGTATFQIIKAAPAQQSCPLNIINDKIKTTDQETYPLITTFEEEDSTCATNTSFELKIKETSGLVSCTGKWCASISRVPLGSGSHMYLFPRDVVPANINHELGLCYTYTPTGGSSKTKCFPIEITITQKLAVDFSKACGLIKASNGFTNTLQSSNQNWVVQGWVLVHPFTNLKFDKSISLTSDWLKSYKSEIEDGKFYSFKVNIASLLGTETRTLFCEASFTFFEMPQIYVKLSATRVDAVSLQDISAEVLTKDGDDSKVKQFTYTWTVEVEANGSFTKLGDITTNSNKFVAESYLFESGKTYRGCVTAVHKTLGKSPTTCKQWTMSTKSQGAISISPKLNLTSKTKVAVTLEKFLNGIKSIKVFCYNSKKDSTKLIKTVANRERIRKLKLPRSDRNSCWLDITDKNGWNYLVNIQASVSQASAESSISAEINATGVVEAIINSDSLEEVFDPTALKAAVKENAINLKGTLTAKAKINGQFSSSDVTSVLGEALEIVKYFDDPKEAAEVIPLADIKELMNYVATDSTASSVSKQAVEATFEALIAAQIEDSSSSDAINIYSSMRTSCLNGCNIKVANGVLKNEKLRVNSLPDTGSTTIKVNPSTSSGLEKVECFIPNSFITTTGTGTQQSEIQAFTTQKKLSTTTKSQITGNDPKVTTISGTMDLQFTTSSGGKIGFDGSTAFGVQFDISSQRQLASTTTTQTPVCMRYDSTTSSWTTDGVTTVDNGGTVSCQTTMAGSVTIKIVTTTTTTSDASNMGLIIALAAGLSVLVLALVVIIILCKKCKKRKLRRHGQTAGFQSGVAVFSDDDTKKDIQITPESPTKMNINVAAKDQDALSDANNSNSDLPTINRIFPNRFQQASHFAPTAQEVQIKPVAEEQNLPWTYTGVNQHLADLPNIPAPTVEQNDDLFTSPYPIGVSSHQGGESPTKLNPPFEPTSFHDNEQVVIVEDVKTNE